MKSSVYGKLIGKQWCNVVFKISSSGMINRSPGYRLGKKKASVYLTQSHVLAFFSRMYNLKRT